MFSPLADTTFSSFFSGAGLGAGHLQHLEWLLRLAPPWKMRQGSLLSWSRTAPAVTPSFSAHSTQHTILFPGPRIFSGSGFAPSQPTVTPALLVQSPVPVSLRGLRWAKEGSPQAWMTLCPPTEGFWLFPRPSYFYSVQRLQSCSFPLSGAWPVLGTRTFSVHWLMQESKPLAPDLFWGFHWTQDTLIAMNRSVLSFTAPRPATRGRLTQLCQLAGQVWCLIMGSEGCGGRGHLCWLSLRPVPSVPVAHGSTFLISQVFIFNKHVDFQRGSFMLSKKAV